ncbi:hypothetical protein HK405_003352, partial [Cladochytrium tenue]
MKNVVGALRLGGLPSLAGGSGRNRSSQQLVGKGTRGVKRSGNAGNRGNNRSGGGSLRGSSGSRSSKSRSQQSRSWPPQQVRSRPIQQSQPLMSRVRPQRQQSHGPPQAAAIEDLASAAVPVAAAAATVSFFASASATTAATPAAVAAETCPGATEAHGPPLLQPRSRPFLMAVAEAAALLAPRPKPPQPPQPPYSPSTTFSAASPSARRRISAFAAAVVACSLAAVVCLAVLLRSAAFGPSASWSLHWPISDGGRSPSLGLEPIAQTSTLASNGSAWL